MLRTLTQQTEESRQKLARPVRGSARPAYDFPMRKPQSILKLAIFALVLLGQVAVANAQTGGGGEAELDQYVPNVPGVGADQPLRDVRAGAAGLVEDRGAPSDEGGLGDAGRLGDEGGGLPTQTLERLRSLGSSGDSAAAVAAATAAATTQPGGNRVGLGSADSARLPAAAVEGRSFLGGLLDSLAGNGGLGILLPLAMLAALVAGVWFAIRRRVAHRSE